MDNKIEQALNCIRQAIDQHGEQLCYPASLGAESSVLIDIICRHKLKIPIFTLDTGKLPPETHHLMTRLEKRYHIDIERIRPDAQEVQNMVRQYGEDLYRKSIELRQRCCRVRKVIPMKQAIGDRAWITGRRRDQGKSRAGLVFVETSPTIGRAKYNPLLNWTLADIWAYIREYDLPYNELFDKHYRSIGCDPCTRAIAVGEDERAGRWWWEMDDAHSECGLHLSPIKQHQSTQQHKADLSMKNQWQGKRVLITGVCGTVGKELLRQLVEHEPYEIIGIDNNESELFFLDLAYGKHSNVHLYLGDLRDKDKLLRKMQGVDIVLHAAALKHVILCEKTPRDAVQTNILGTQNVIDAAVANHVSRVLFTSSDKAVNPTNVMGTTKLMGERLMTAANAMRRSNDPIFASTRFGNVLGSRGSVIPLFRKQIMAGGPVTLTDPNMTRFIMTLEDAVRLVMESVFLACGGEVFVTKMPIARIVDLAEVMIEELAPKPDKIEIKIIGCKPGEKLYEELMNDEETRRTVELQDYFSVLPAFKSVYERIAYQYSDADKVGIDAPYNSSVQSAMSKEDLRHYLKTNKLIGEEA